MLRNQTFKPELASLAEKIRSYLALLKGVEGEAAAGSLLPPPPHRHG
jgi:hypothetical protein